MFGFNFRDRNNHVSIYGFNSVFIKPSQKYIIERRDAEEKAAIEKAKRAKEIMENDIEYIRNTKGDKHAKKMAKDRLSRNPDLIKERMVLNDIIQKEEAARIAAEEVN